LNQTFGVLEQTSIGPISMIAGDHGLQRIEFASLKSVKKSLVTGENSPSLNGMETISTMLAELSEFLFGIRKTFSVDIDWSVITGFQRDVLQFTYEIPFGEVRTYGSISKALGKPNAARAVGSALARNPIPIVIPCHRVVGTDRLLHGFAAPDGIKTKAFLLELEGREFVNNRIVL
jgi:methylated-DNA-[protein]-cysteine S-methyltransferase